jgi:hypothetical protein
MLTRQGWDGGILARAGIRVSLTVVLLFVLACCCFGGIFFISRLFICAAELDGLALFRMRLHLSKQCKEPEAYNLFPMHRTRYSSEGPWFSIKGTLSDRMPFRQYLGRPAVKYALHQHFPRTLCSRNLS